MGLLKAILVVGAGAAGAAVVYAIGRAATAQARGELPTAGEAAQVVATKIETATQTVAAAVKEGARKVVRTVSGIPQAVLDNFKKYDIAALIDKYRDGLPWGLGAGIIYVESKGDPTIVNKKSGATGLVQILGGSNSRGLTAEQRKDPDASLRVIMPEWRRFLQRAKDAGVTDERDQWSYTYYAHNQGAGAQQIVLKYAAEGFESALQHYRNFPWLKPKAYRAEVAAAKKAGKAQRAMTAEEQAAYEKSVAAHIASATKVARTAADKSAEFAAAEASIKGGAAVVGADVETDDDAAPVDGPADVVEALNLRLQAAYLARDLDRVAELQAELETLTDDDDNAAGAESEQTA